MQIIFLGTSSMVPTKERNHSSIYMSFKGEGFLMDCGEGTQRQIKMAGVRPSNIDNLIISHWHGDHVLGIPGLLQTLGNNGYEKTLKIFGPRGTRKYMEKTFSFFSTECKVDYEVTEVEDGQTFIDKDDYSMKAFRLNHGIECLGYVFEEKDRRRINKKFIETEGIPQGPHLGKLQRGESITWKGKQINVSDATYKIKGKKIGFIFDTKTCENCSKIAEDADLLISEATFTDALKENAEQYKHLTAREAGRIAKENAAKRMILTHFSQRYKNANEALKDAKKEFKEVEAAKDLLKITL